MRCLCSQITQLCTKAAYKKAILGGASAQPTLAEPPLDRVTDGASGRITLIPRSHGRVLKKSHTLLFDGALNLCKRRVVGAKVKRPAVGPQVEMEAPSWINLPADPISDLRSLRSQARSHCIRLWIFGRDTFLRYATSSPPSRSHGCFVLWSSKPTVQDHAQHSKALLGS